MLHKRRIGQLRRILSVESLEDRTVLSGNVFASQDIFSGLVKIETRDNGNHSYTIQQTANLGSPTLSVTGSLTAINFIPNGTANFQLGTVSAIQIVDGNGTNTISIKFIPLPGNIGISVGAGVNTVTLDHVVTNAGQISFFATGGTDTITENFVVAGSATILTGGKATVTQNNVSFGFDSITAAADTISITNSRFANTQRSVAIGQLAINTLSGDDSININNISVGQASVVASGAGKDTIMFDNSTIQSATIQNGSHSVTPGTSSLNFSNNLITGNGNAVTINLLNSSGTVPFGSGNIYHLTMNNVQFTGGGNISVEVDSGVPYEGTDSAGNPILTEASTVAMSLVDTTGTITINLGNHFQVATLGTGTVGLNDLDASVLNVNIGNDNDIVVVSANILGGFDGASETVTIGDVTTNHLGGAATPTPSVLINGVWNTKSGNNVTVNLGTNANTNLGSGWPIRLNEQVSGNLTIGPILGRRDDGLALNVNSTTVGGTTAITLGSGGVNHFESLTLMAVSSSNVSIAAFTAPGDAPNSGGGGLVVNMTNVLVTNPFGLPGLIFIDFGSGVDTVTMTNVNVVEQLLMRLSASGSNVLSAQHVTCAFGTIDGGVGFGNIYIDLGGNFGYTVTDFVGH